MQPDFQSFTNELEKIATMAGFKKALGKKSLSELASMAAKTRAPAPRVSLPTGMKPAGLAKRQAQLHNVDRAQGAIMDAMRKHQPKSREEILEAMSAFRKG